VTVDGVPLDELYVAEDAPLDEPQNPTIYGPLRLGAGQLTAPS
jgi:hypothetical protein